MRLLFVVDGRSPIAMNWISYCVDAGHEVHLVSTYPCETDIEFASIHIIPVAFSSFRSGRLTGSAQKSRIKRYFRINSIKLRTALRHWFGPLTLTRSSKQLSEIIGGIKPDLIHAMRIPFEGMLAAIADPSMPLLVSVWGNDFTLHAQATRQMAKLTQYTLDRIDAIHTDCHRDVRLASEWGFENHKSAVVLPGGGGVQLDVFYPDPSYKTRLQNTSTNELIEKKDHAAEESWFTVINPRGFRTYVRNDIFFQAIPLVIARVSQVKFVCTNMEGEPEAERWVNDLGIGDHVKLLPYQSRNQMAEEFRNSRLLVSPSLHDGTPNSLLEGMACGCLPVMGDIESIREWVTPGKNGLLFDPTDPRSMADAILTGLTDDELIRRAFNYNLDLVADRAEHQQVMESAVNFYRDLVVRIS